MSDIDRGRKADEDRLPWLEPVDEQVRDGGPGAGKLIAVLLVALLVIGLVVGGIFWMSDVSGRSDGPGDLIAAPAGDYKVKPDEPGGMKVEGEGDTAYSASDGRETNARIDLNAVPETPVSGAGSVAKPGGAPNAVAAAKPNAPAAVGKTPAQTAVVVPLPKTGEAPAAPPKVAIVQPKAPVAAKPETQAAATASGPQVQLGAFGSEAKANAAWKALSTRFSFLAPLEKTVTQATVGSGTVYRLRASAGGQAKSICAKLKVAGESCAIIG